MGKDITDITIVQLIALFILFGREAPIEDGLAYHLLYPFFHASLYHLIGNCFAAWFVIDRPKTFIIGYIIAVAALFISPMSVPTIGLSGVIYAGMGYRIDGRRFFRSFGGIVCCAYLIAGLLLPGVNGLLHIICFVTGFTIGLIGRFIKRNNDVGRRYYS